MLKTGLWKGLVARGAARSDFVAVPGACLSCRFLAVTAARAHPRPLVAESRARLRFNSGGMRSSWSEKLGLAPKEYVAVSFTGGNNVTVTVQAQVGHSIFQVRDSKPSPWWCSKAPSPGQRLVRTSVTERRLPHCRLRARMRWSWKLFARGSWRVRHGYYPPHPQFPEPL